MNPILRSLVTVVLCSHMAALPLLAEDAKPNAAPEIVHEPVAQGVRGQALTLKAKVTDDKNDVASVTMYYTLAKDAAPFKIPLKPAGLDFYIGTIEGGVLGDIASMSYYVEAQDGWGATRETPWYVVSFKDPKQVAAPPTTAVPLKPVGGPTGKSTKDKDGIPLGIIAGGAVAVIGGALLLSDSGGGGGGDDNDGGGGGGSVTNAGTYAGTIITCQTVSGGTTTCDPTRSIEIVIDSQGTVFSDDLFPGQGLTGSLNGNSFLLSTPINDEVTGSTGEIRYEGAVFGNQISGRVTGSTQSPTSSSVYTGSFSASR